MTGGTKTAGARVVGRLIARRVAGQASGAGGAAEGSGDAGAEAEVQAAAERGKALELLASGRIEDLPVEGGILFDGGEMSESPAEGDGVGVHLTVGSANEGGKVVALVVVVKQIMAVLDMLCASDSRRLVGAPRGEIGSLPDEAVGDGDVGDDVGDVPASVEANVGAAFQARSVGGGRGARKGSGVVGPVHARVGSDLSPHVEDVLVGGYAYAYP